MGSAYPRIRVFLLGISNYRSIDTFIMGRIMGKYTRHKKTPVKTRA